MCKTSLSPWDPLHFEVYQVSRFASHWRQRIRGSLHVSRCCVISSAKTVKRWLTQTGAEQTRSHQSSRTNQIENRLDGRHVCRSASRRKSIMDEAETPDTLKRSRFGLWLHASRMWLQMFAPGNMTMWCTLRDYRWRSSWLTCSLDSFALMIRRIHTRFAFL